jgi:hypothetical protein
VLYPPRKGRGSRENIPARPPATMAAAQAPWPTVCSAWSYVHLVERYPVLQGHGMCRVLAIGTLLAHVPEAERSTYAATLTECSLPDLWARARTLPRLPVRPPYIVVADQPPIDTAKTPRQEGSHGHVAASSHRISGYVRDHGLKAQLQQALAEVLPSPRRPRRGPYGAPHFSPAVLARVGVTYGRAVAAWRRATMGEQFPVLQAAEYTQEKVLGLSAVLHWLPPEEHAATVERLRNASLRAIRAEMRLAKQRAKRLQQAQHVQKPKRVSKRLTGALWREKLAEVHHHLIFLRREGLVEDLVRSWTPENARGYRAELGRLLAELSEVEQRMGLALCEGTPRLHLIAGNSPAPAEPERSRHDPLGRRP